MVLGMKQQQYNTRLTATKCFLGVVSLMCGCMIYLLFRSKSINIYLWSESVGLKKHIDYLRNSVCDWQVNDFFKYSLPDCLYCIAYILLIDAIWQDDNRPIKFFIIAIVPIIAIVYELLQFYGIVYGTYDVTDLVCYTLPLVLYFILICFKNFYNNKFKTQQL